jgi:hypothetical protein
MLCNFSTDADIDIHALLHKVRSKSQISTNIVYLVEHKTIQSFVLKLRLQVEIQLCNTSPFP